MRITNSTSAFVGKQVDITKNIKEIDKGITKRLLEKYKPKGVCNIDRIRNRKDHKRLA